MHPLSLLPELTADTSQTDPSQCSAAVEVGVSSSVFKLGPVATGFVFGTAVTALSPPHPQIRIGSFKKHKGKEVCGQHQRKPPSTAACICSTQHESGLCSAPTITPTPIHSFCSHPHPTTSNPQPPTPIAQTPARAFKDNTTAATNPSAHRINPAVPPICCPPQHLHIQHPQSSSLVSLCLLNPAPELELLQQFLNTPSAQIPISRIFGAHEPSPALQPSVHPQPTPLISINSCVPPPPIHSTLPPSPPSTTRRSRGSCTHKLMIPFFLLTLLVCIPLGEAVIPGTAPSSSLAELSAVGTLTAAAITAATGAFHAPQPAVNPALPAPLSPHPPPQSDPQASAPLLSPPPQSPALSQYHPSVAATNLTPLGSQRPPQSRHPNPTPTTPGPQPRFSVGTPIPPATQTRQPALNSTPTTSSVGSHSRLYATDTAFHSLKVAEQLQSPPDEFLRECDKCTASVRYSVYRLQHQYRNGSCPPLPSVSISADVAGPSNLHHSRNVRSRHGRCLVCADSTQCCTCNSQTSGDTPHLS